MDPPVLIPAAYVTALIAATFSLVPGAIVVYSYCRTSKLRTLPTRLQFYPLLAQFLWGLCVVVPCIFTSVAGGQTSTSTSAFGLTGHFAVMITIFFSAVMFIHLRSVLMKAAGHFRRYGNTRPLMIAESEYSKAEWSYTFVVIVLASVCCLFPLLSVLGVTQLPTIDPRVNVTTASQTYRIYITGTSNLSYDLIAWRLAIFSGPALLVLLVNAAIALWAVFFVRSTFREDSTLLWRITTRSAWYLAAYAVVWLPFVAEDLYLLQEDPNPSTRDRIPLWLTVIRALLFHLQGFFAATAYLVYKWSIVKALLPHRMASLLSKVGVIVATIWGVVEEVLTCGGSCSEPRSSSSSSSASSRASSFFSRQKTGRFGSSASASLLLNGSEDAEARKQKGAARARLLWPQQGGESASALPSPRASLHNQQRDIEEASFFSDDESTTGSTAIDGPGAPGGTGGRPNGGDSVSRASVNTTTRSVLHNALGGLDAWEIAKDAADAIEASTSSPSPVPTTKPRANANTGGGTGGGGGVWTVKIFKRPGRAASSNGLTATNSSSNNNKTGSLRQGLLAAAASVEIGIQHPKTANSNGNPALLTSISSIPDGGEKAAVLSSSPPPFLPPGIRRPPIDEELRDLSAPSSTTTPRVAAPPENDGVGKNCAPTSPIAIPGVINGTAGGATTTTTSNDEQAHNAVPTKDGQHAAALLAAQGGGAAIGLPALAAALLPPPEAVTTSSPLPLVSSAEVKAVMALQQQQHEGAMTTSTADSSDVSQSSSAGKNNDSSSNSSSAGGAPSHFGYGYEDDDEQMVVVVGAAGKTKMKIKTHGGQQRGRRFSNSDGGGYSADGSGSGSGSGSASGSGEVSPVTSSKGAGPGETVFSSSSAKRSRRSSSTSGGATSPRNRPLLFSLEPQSQHLAAPPAGVPLSPAPLPPPAPPPPAAFAGSLSPTRPKNDAVEAPTEGTAARAGAMPLSPSAGSAGVSTSKPLQHPLSASRLYQQQQQGGGGSTRSLGTAAQATTSQAPRSASSLYRRGYAMAPSSLGQGGGAGPLQGQGVASSLSSSLPPSSYYLPPLPQTGASTYQSPPASNTTAAAAAAVRGYGASAAAVRGLVASPPSTQATAGGGGAAATNSNNDFDLMAAGMASLNPRARRIPMAPPHHLHLHHHDGDDGGASSLPSIFKPKPTDDGVGGPASIFQPVRNKPIHVYHLGQGPLYNKEASDEKLLSGSSAGGSSKGEEAAGASAPAGSLLLSDYFDGGQTTATAMVRATTEEAEDEAAAGSSSKQKKRRKKKSSKSRKSVADDGDAAETEKLPEEQHQPQHQGEEGGAEEEDDDDALVPTPSLLAVPTLNDTIGSIEH
jgi:hypothetical protein